MLHRWKELFSTLRVRISLIAALCWLLPTVVLGIYMGSVFFDALHEKVEALLISNATHVEEMAIRRVDALIDLGRDAVYDGKLEDAVTNYERDSRYTDFHRKSRLYLEQKYARNRTLTFAAFFLLDAPDRIMYTSFSEEAVQAFQDNLQDDAIHQSEEIDTRNRFYYRNGALYLVRNLYNRKMEPYGMLVLGVDEKRLLEDLYDPQTMLDGKLELRLDEFYWPETNASAEWDLERTGLYNEDSQLIYAGYEVTPDYKLSYRICLDRSRVFAQSNQFSQLLMLLLLLLLPLEVSIMYMAYHRLVKPLNVISKAAARMESGEMGVQVSMQRQDEIGDVGRAFNAMSLQVQNLIDKSYKEEIILRDARIQALQSRINPHFLNNTLEIINWQARMEGSETISDMIDALSILMNAGMDRKGARVVTLGEEIETAHAYLYFLTLRFGDKLKVEEKIDPALLDCGIPILTIQPLLENAVKHGLESVGGGWIKLEAYALGDSRACLKVTNGGQRMAPEDVRRVQDILHGADQDLHSEHLGIRNINMRLHLIYGNTALLDLAPDVNGDTCARIILPGENCISLRQLNNHKQEKTHTANEEMN